MTVINSDLDWNELVWANRKNFYSHLRFLLDFEKAGILQIITADVQKLSWIN